MTMDAAVLGNILRIGHDTTQRGTGLSLRAALSKTDYRTHRGDFGPEDLILLLRAQPELVSQWQMYSQDKRTTGGWSLTERRVANLSMRTFEEFASVEEAVANYVVRELDFWSTVSSNAAT